MPKLYQAIAHTHRSMVYCEASANSEWAAMHRETLDALLSKLPSGAGFDAGSTMTECGPARMVFHTSYHHMNEDGYYVGWTEHNIVIKPEWDGFHIRVTGPNKRDCKDYIESVFYDTLMEDA